MDPESWTKPPELPWQTLDSFLTGVDHRVEDEDSERWVSYSIDDLYPAWHERAHCRGVGHQYYFGDEAEQPTMSIKQVRRASKLCDVCPVYVECLTWALTTREEYGVWAGTSGRMRRRIFKLMDNGDATVAQVVERFLDGQGDTYRNGQEPGPKKEFSEYAPEPVSRLGGGGTGVRPAVRGEVAL